MKYEDINIGDLINVSCCGDKFGVVLRKIDRLSRVDICILNWQTKHTKDSNCCFVHKGNCPRCSFQWVTLLSKVKKL